MLRPAAMTLIALCTACADDPDPAPLDPTPLAEVCGVAGPFHLLPLAPEERAGADSGSILAIGDRLLLVVGTGERRISPASGPEPEHSRVYSVGPCGEGPIVVAHDVERLHIDPRWPDLVLACPLRGRDLLRLDLSGAREPILLAADACHAVVTDHGLLNYVNTDDARTGVDFYPFLDPAAPTFGDPIHAAAPVPVINSTQGSIVTLPDEILLVEPGGDLIGITLPDLQRTVLQTGVVVFAAAPDGSHLLYQLAPSSGDDPYNPIGNIHLLDRNTHGSQIVGRGALGTCYPCYPAPGLARFDVEEGNSRHQRLVTLSDFKLINVPAGQDLVTRLADGRWFSDGDPFDSGTYIVDLETDAASLVSSRYGLRLLLTDEHVDFLHLSRSSRPQDSAPLVRYYFDEREPRTLAEQANVHAIVRDDGRVLTMRSVDDAWLGELTLVDPTTHEATSLADHVVAVTSLGAWHLPEDPGTIVYGVVDGDRTGVWLARPVPIK